MKKNLTRKVLPLSVVAILTLSLIFGLITRQNSQSAKNRPIASNNIPEGSPGSLYLQKSVTTTSVEDVWKVTLSVAGEKPPTTSIPSESTDIIILLDASSSMRSPATRIPNAQASMRTLVNKLWDGTPNSNSYRISLVAFGWYPGWPPNNPFTNSGLVYPRGSNPDGTYPRYPVLAQAKSNATTLMPLTSYSANDKQELIWMIDGLVPHSFNGDTPTSRALIEAQNVLTPSTAKHKIVVMITDGVPIGNIDPNYSNISWGPAMEAMKYFNDVKRAGIQIYTAGFDLETRTTNPPPSFFILQGWFQPSRLLFINGGQPGYTVPDIIKEVDDPSIPFGNSAFKTLYADSLLQYGASFPKGKTTGKVGNTFMNFTASATTKDYEDFFETITTALVVETLPANKATVHDEIGEDFEIYNWPSENVATANYTYWPKAKPKDFKAPNPAFKQTGANSFEWYIENFAPKQEPDTFTYYIKLRTGAKKPNSTYPVNSMSYIAYDNYLNQSALKYFPEAFIETDGRQPQKEIDAKQNEFKDSVDFSPINYEPTKASEGFKPPSLQKEKAKPTEKPLTKEQQQLLEKQNNGEKQKEKPTPTQQAAQEPTPTPQQTAVENQQPLTNQQARELEEKQKLTSLEQSASRAKTVFEKAQQRQQQAEEKLSKAQQNSSLEPEKLEALEKSVAKATNQLKQAKKEMENTQKIFEDFKKLKNID